MTDIVSIELLLDPETEASVRREWERLADAGMSSLARHPSPTNRPHVTLLVRRELADERFVAAVARLPVAIRLAEPVVFRHGDRGVLAWGVDPGDALRDLHRAVHDAAGIGEDAPHTTPGEWTPHITLARRLRLDALDDAVALLDAPRSGSGVALRRWDSAAAEVTPLG